ncbi:MAG: hypothetical protein MUE40_00525 [Anaerolineae bacterium]|jgi:hypothetical protein|nr:hypothetical protein [Anaerolineae bacterium]
MMLLDAAAIIGQGAVIALLLLLARLSQRLGTVTHARPHYRGLYVAALLVAAGLLGRLYYLTLPPSTTTLNQNLVYIILCDGLPALGVTLALVITWYYWSWLLAERD